jgi:hypothetical protein
MEFDSWAVGMRGLNLKPSRDDLREKRVSVDPY